MADRDHDPVGIISRIRYMLEYMALCADPTLFDVGSAAQSYPAPSGVPMGIVTLPDFVVDVAIDSLMDATGTDRGHINPLDVGGRAGRLAWVLQEFGGQRNAWYHVKYVAKAGGVGRVVLQRRFLRANGSVTFEPVSLRYILPSRPDSDWLHVYGGDVRPSESSNAGLGVTFPEIDELPYLLTDLFVDSRYVVIASKDAGHAIEAISLVGEGLRRLSSGLHRKMAHEPEWRIPFGLLLDLSALGDADEASSVAAAFVSMQQDLSQFAIESTALWHQESDFLSPFNHVLVRDAGSARIGDASERLPGIGTHPVARETFTAGYALASACNLGWRLLRQWYNYFPHIRPLDASPHTSYPHAMSVALDRDAPKGDFLPSMALAAPDSLDIRDRLRFAATWSRSTDSAPLSYRKLVLAASRASPQRRDAIAQMEVRSAAGNQSDRADIMDIMKGFASSSTSDTELVPRFTDPRTDTLSLFVPTCNIERFALSCLARDERYEFAGTKAPIDKAVMFDLDATLLDSEGLRRACWFNGLQAMFREIGLPMSGAHIQTVIQIYNRFIYKNYARFQSLLKDLPDIPSQWQPCDFRQVWNHPYAWAALLWTLEFVGGNTLIGHEWDDAMWQQILKSHHSKGGCECQVCGHLEPLLAEHRNPYIQDRRIVSEALRLRLTRFRFAVQAARVAFWEVDYPCYTQARACVQMLRETPGCEVYVATEGHEETQIQKLICTGLGDLFPRSRVLSTGAASSAEDDQTALQKLLQSSKNVRDELRAAEKLLGQDAKRNIEPLINKRETTIRCVEFLIGCLNALYMKSHKRFYSAVIDAIRHDPESPARVLRSFLEKEVDALGDQLGPNRPMRFFMVGDRYDNDCRPLLEMFPSKSKNSVGVGTCRILSGKRAREFCPPSLPPQDGAKKSEEVPSTKYVCDTLMQVAYIVSKTSSWEEIDLLEDVTPPVLLELREGDILYSSKPASDAETGDPTKAESSDLTLEMLAPRFQDLSWARQDEDLHRERAVQNTLEQIERDLAVCDDTSLCRLFDRITDDLKSWWRLALQSTLGSQEPALDLIKGALRLLAGVNSWRYRLQRPPLQIKVDAKATLEWFLGTQLLRQESIPSVRTTRGVIQWAQEKMLPGIQPRDVLQAIPCSEIAVALLGALVVDERLSFVFRDSIKVWLENAQKLSRKKRASA